MGHPGPEGGDGPPAPLVPVHPEPVPGEAQVLRWVVPADALGFVGVPAGVPPALRNLLDGGVLAALAVEPAAVRTTLAAGLTWREHGGRVREALQAALATPDGWQPPAGGANADDVLRMAFDEVLGGEVGDYIRSHGGRIELLSAADDEVVVRLDGACAHCPASDGTLTERIETGLRARYPGLTRLTARTDPGLAAGRRLLRVFPTTRR